MQNHDTKMLQRDRIVLCDNHGILGQDYCPGYDQLTNFQRFQTILIFDQK